jgi:hypothetical protein
MKQLNKTYVWFQRKLEAIGQLTDGDRQEEEVLLNPAKI